MDELISKDRESELDRLARREHRLQRADMRFGAVAAELTRAALFPASAAGLSENRQVGKTDNGKFVVKFSAGMRLDPKNGEITDDEVPTGGYANFAFLWLATRTRAAIIDGWQRDQGAIPLPGVRSALTAAAGIGRGGNQERDFLTALRRVQNVDANIWFKEEKTGGVVLRKLALMGEQSAEFFYDTGDELPGMSPKFMPTPLMEWFARQPGAAPVDLRYVAALANSSIAQQALLWASREVWALQRSRDAYRDFSYAQLATDHTHDLGSVRDFTVKWRAALKRIFEFWPALESVVELDQPDPTDKRKKMIRLTRSTDRSVQLIQDRDARPLLLGQGFDQL